MGSTAVCNPKAINLIFSCPCSVLQGSQTWAGCRQQLRWHELLISPCQPPPGQWLRHGQARPFVPQEQSKPICPQKAAARPFVPKSSSSSIVSCAPQALAPSQGECTHEYKFMVGWLSQMKEITKTKIWGPKPCFQKVMACSVRILKISLR